MTNRRLQSILSVIVLCIIAICVFVSCGNQQHTHDYGEWTVVREATCETDGLKERACKGCDETQQETIAAIGHSYGEFCAEVASTCIAEGVKGHFECSACHKYFDADKHEISDLTIAKVQHTYGAWIAEVASTCTAEGVKGHYECSVCHKYFDANNNEISDLTIEKAEHTYGEWIAEIPTTCTAEGVKGHYECSVCRKNFDADKKELSNLTIPQNHVLIFVEGKRETCVDKGVKDAYRCSVCRQFFDADGEKVTDRSIPARGHNFGSIIAEVAATETKNGVKAHKDCLDCNLHFDLDDNELSSLIIPASSHVYTWVDEVPATCENDGKKAHYECSHCSLVFDKNYNVVEDLTIAHGHDLISYNRVDATCQYDGHVAYDYCKKCDKNFDKDGKELDKVIISKLGHAFGQWIDEVPATCTVNGVRAHKTCSRCNGHFDEEDYMYHSIEIPAHHDYTLVDEVSATCTTSGMQAHGQCTVCGKTLDSFGNEVTDTESLVIPQKGHAYGDWAEGKQATCDELGMLGHYHCARCDKDFDIEGTEIAEIYIQSLGHDYTTDEIISEVVAKCTTDGTKAHYECKRCNMFFGEDGGKIDDIIIKKLGHKEGTRVGAIPVDCTTDGRREYYVCSECGDMFLSVNNVKTISEEELIVKAYGHKFEHHEKIDATCGTDGTVEYYYCNRCDRYFDADNNEIYDLTIEATEQHTFGNLIEGTEPTDTELGTVAHYECSVCHKLFDIDENEISTIYNSETSEHDFEWRDEELPECKSQTPGMEGHYYCAHCEGLFDKDYQKVEAADLVIPARHELGSLVPASQGKCGDYDILVSYYFCANCYSYFDEDMREIDWDKDICFYAERHNYVYSCASWGHSAICLDCENSILLEHEFTYTFYVKDGENYEVGHCKYCGFDDEPVSYETVESIKMKHDFYVGYNHTSDLLILIKDRINLSEKALYSVMSADEYDKFEKYVEYLQNKGITDPVTKTYDVSYDNYTGTLEITFRPYKFYGIVTEQKYYQQGQASFWDGIRFVIDSNFTRETGEVVYANGSVDKNNVGGFDENYDFAATGESEVTFTVAYILDEKSYNVDVTLVGSVLPLRFSNDDMFTWIMCGGIAKIGVVYTDGELREFDLTDKMIVGGTFDSSKLGKQTFTVRVGDLVGEISITVRDPYEVIYFSTMYSNINLGEDLYIDVEYLCGESSIVKVTPDMIIGNFDNTVAGYYEIMIMYGGIIHFESVDVIDVSDSRINYISTIFNSYVWDVDDDGNVVPNLEYLYLVVYKMNDTISYIKVTANMISYDEAEAKDAYTKSDKFTVTLTYYGKTTKINVAPRKVSEQTVTDLRVYDTTNLSYGSNQSICMNDGNIDRYFVVLRIDDAFFGTSLDKAMFYDSETLVPFDFATAQNGRTYDVVVKCADAERKMRLLVYTKSDIMYSLSGIDNLNDITVGTREEVLAQLVGKKLSLQMFACNNSIGANTIYFEDVIVAPNEEIDFSKPGHVWLEVSYKGIVSKFMITLVPDVKGFAKTTYTLDGWEFTMYANGYFSYQYSGWGTYALVNDELKIYRLAFFDRASETFVRVDNQSAIYFTAEMLKDNLEVYSLFTTEGFCTAYIYTKNGFSMADIYDAEDHYQYTTVAVFSLDGKSVQLMDVEYVFGENDFLDIKADGNVVYRCEDEQNGNVIIRQTFNDNGKVYCFVIVLDDNGNETEENVFAVYEWEENDGVITVYERGIPQFTGKIIDGYFVSDIL